MRTRATIAVLFLAILGGTAVTDALAQEREDAFYVRFLADGQSITIDGDLGDAAWAQAETKSIIWGASNGLPGGGWRIEDIGGGITEPNDPPAATFRALASGNDLYMAIEVQDQSVGGARGLWKIDGILMPFGRWSKYGPTNDGNTHFKTGDEFTYAFWNSVDTTETGAPMPGIQPTRHAWDAAYGVGANFSVVDSSYTVEQLANWEAVTVVDGTSSDDSGDPDTGYVMEMRINLEPMGYHISDAGGDIALMGLALLDADWYWGGNPDERATSWTWLQTKWANSFATGGLRMVFDPAVTTAGEPLNLLPPDVIIPNGDEFDAPVVDGVLDDDVWMHSSPAFQLQYGNEDLLATLPNVTRLWSGYYRPGGQWTIPAVDANVSTVHWFFRDDMLYLGVDVDDQAVDTLSGEGGDGIRFEIDDRTEIGGDNRFASRNFSITVGPDGTPRLEGYFLDLDPSAYEAALSLKGASTAADPTDVDEGFQVEIAIDLVAALGYPAGRGDGAIFVSSHAFDSDRFEDSANDYNARVWWARERSDGPAAWGYMDPMTPVNVASEPTAELPNQIRLDGNYPNPFNPSTSLRYALPDAGNVSILVYDVLGRQVSTLVLGPQAAGMQQARFDAAGIASGVYLYRVELRTAAGAVQHSAFERMILVK